METQPSGIDPYKVQIAEAFDLFYGEGNSPIRLTEEQHLTAFLGVNLDYLFRVEVKKL